MTARSLPPLLLLLFVGSGCAALIYEVVWFQLLELVIGSSAVSMAVLLGTFMGGMCLGSLSLPRLVPVSAHPLRVYGWLEAGIGAMGLLILAAMPLVGGAYTVWAGPGMFGILLRGVVAAVCLLPPTFLMGATLPAVARWVERSPDGVAWLGFFYGGNTAGAVLGSLLAGFYLLSSFDVSVTTYVAVALNLAVAAAAMALAARAPHANADIAASGMPPARSAGTGRRIIYVAAALSGFTALASEVIWTRLLSLLLGATVYTFSLILAVFLFGLGVGSSVGSMLGRVVKAPAVALAWCQVGLGVAMAWAAYLLAQALPFWPVNPSLAASAWVQFQLDVVRTALAVLPGALLWGASFPLALAAVADSPGDPAREVGRVYAANTFGAILGSIAAGLVLIVLLGTRRAEQALIFVSALTGAALLVDAKRPAWMPAAAMAVAFLMAATVAPVPGLFVAFGRFTATQVGQASVIYVGEGWNASVAVSERANGVRNYHNAGKVQASSEPQDMRLQRMLGHLTTLVPKSPRRVLVIGCGAGVTAGAVSIDPAVTRETIVEIEPLVPRVASAFFSAHNFDVVRNSKVEVRVDDARHFLFTTRETFDAITSDPLDPWVKGAAMLYTREFFELVKSRLSPGGLVTLFVQLYESNTAAVKSELATFFEAFPEGMVFANTYNGSGYDLVLVGQVEGTRVDLDEIDARLQRPEYGLVARSLSEVGMESVVDLFATYAGSADDLKPWLRDAEINRDRNLRLQFLAGRGLNLYQAAAIFAEMVPYARVPTGIFTGSDDLLASLTAKMTVGWGR